MPHSSSLALVLAWSLVAGCAGTEKGGLPEVQGGAELGLRRGSAWSTLKVKPPYVIGPRVNLHMNHGTFAGSIDGRGVNLKVDDDGIHGQGPSGAVAVDVEDDQDALVFEGTWNGSRVHFRVTADSMRGTIAIRHFGRADSFSDISTCQYVLDKVETDGARSGTSICSGMPQETRLEVPGAAQTWLTRKELVLVLLALLSSPPTSATEPMP